MFDSATLPIIEKRSLIYWTKCFFEYFMITALKEQMCAYHQKFTPGATLSVPLSAEELQKVIAESV